jgi:hypothetical protein
MSRYYGVISSAPQAAMICDGKGATFVSLERDLLGKHDITQG